MVKETKERDVPRESIEELRESIKRHQRLLELQARLFILASAFGTQFQGEDVAAIGWMLVQYCKHQDQLLRRGYEKN